MNLITTEMVKAAVVSEYDSMLVNVGASFEDWLEEVEHNAVVSWESKQKEGWK